MLGLQKVLCVFVIITRFSSSRTVNSATADLLYDEERVLNYRIHDQWAKSSVLFIPDKSTDLLPSPFSQ